jgi:hypothetical protein
MTVEEGDAEEAIQAGPSFQDLRRELLLDHTSRTVERLPDSDGIVVCLAADAELEGRIPRGDRDPEIEPHRSPSVSDELHEGGGRPQSEAGGAVRRRHSRGRKEREHNSDRAKDERRPAKRRHG